MTLRKKLLKILTVLLVIAGLCILAWYVAVYYAGEKAIDVLTSSVDFENPPEEIAEALKSIEAESSDDEAATEQPAEEKSPPTKANKKNETGTTKKIEFSDKQAAINLAYSRFSAAEINEGLQKLQRGLTKEEISYYKSLAYSRFTAEEIKQIKEWYYKYK